MVICLLQELGLQSNFGDTLECVDRVERTSKTVSFALVHVRGVRCCIGTIEPCCGTAEVVFVCTLVAVHVIRYLPYAHTCILMRMYVCHIVCHYDYDIHV